MSNALLTVTFSDGTKLYSQYQGSSDSCYSNLFDTKEEAWSYDRHSNAPHPMNDNRIVETPETVEIHSGYGGGYSWLGVADRKNKVILGPFSTYEIYEKYDNVAHVWKWLCDKIKKQKEMLDFLESKYPSGAEKNT